MMLQAPFINVNPYAISEYASLTGYQDTIGRVETNATIATGEKTLLVFIIDQSTGANDRPDAVAVVNSAKLRQINPYDGKVYRALDPQLGPNGTFGCWYTKAFDTMIANGIFGSVIMSNGARSGQGSTSWRGFRLAQGNFYHHAMVHVRRARALGLFVPNADLHVAVQIGFGVTDGMAGVSSADYQANVLDLIGGMQDQGLPSTAKVFLNVSTMDSNLVNANIQGAQAALVDNAAGRFAGANLDSLTGSTNRRPDGTHLTNVGYEAAATLLVTAYDAAY